MIRKPCCRFQFFPPSQQIFSENMWICGAHPWRQYDTMSSEWNELNAQSESMWQIPQVNVCHKFNCILLSRSYKGFIVGKFYARETLKRFFWEFWGEIVSQFFDCFMIMVCVENKLFLEFKLFQKNLGESWNEGKKIKVLIFKQKLFHYLKLVSFVSYIRVKNNFLDIHRHTFRSILYGKKIECRYKFFYR